MSAALVCVVTWLGSAEALAAPPPEPRPADDFRRSDPQEAELAPVAKSSGLSDLTAVQPRTDILTLDEVLDAVIASDPRLAQARIEIDAVEGKLLAARGGFDPKVAMRGLIQPLGYYRHGIVDVRVEQPTPLWGLGVFAGWRLGLGEFAVYDAKLPTADGGELRAGVSVPVWQGGPIDRTRADISQARIGQRRAGLERDAKQLELEAKAAQAYWNWVATGLALEIERGLLEIALTRDVGLRRQVELGDLESIVATDNRRVILGREARVVGAEREFQRASLELSLFLRDPSGDPRLAGAERLPLQFPPAGPPPIVDIDAEIQAAIERRPDLAAVLAARDQAEVEVRLAKNLRSPEIDLSAWAAKDIGPGTPEQQPVELAAMIEIQVPIPLRKARGQLQTARAELSSIDAQLRFARDRVAVDVRDAHSAVAAAYQKARLADEQVELAQTLAHAELRRFTLGDGDLLLVNLRELAVATAAREQVEALAALMIAQAQLQVAQGGFVSH
ncbi:Outer membrane component of multidrug efflux pump [Enhygromyxa salina]|uniref:Outer membrane component of multidrug efflux pump n=1 Tax=Enhygromyxa salina TaxID=215803 RepID=A0A0C2D9L8_9BACT|nr:Outer membrane component of multidrug efflux pump [Enhygromyxa salina]